MLHGWLQPQLLFQYLLLPLCQNPKLLHFISKFVASVPLNPRRRTEEERQKEKEKREIRHDFCVPQLPACQQVIQAVSLSTMKPVTQPANKPTAPFHSVGPLAWDQVMPLNKELLSCITSPQRGHPGRSLLSPGSASLQHTRPPPHRPLHCFLLQPFSHYTSIIMTLYAGEGFYFSFQEGRQKGALHIKKTTNPSANRNFLKYRLTSKHKAECLNVNNTVGFVFKV